MDAMKDEMKSPNQNKLWDLIKLPKGYKKFGSKWVFKTKRGKGNIERFKVILSGQMFHLERRHWLSRDLLPCIEEGLTDNHFGIGSSLWFGVAPKVVKIRIYVGSQEVGSGCRS